MRLQNNNYLFRCISIFGLISFSSQVSGYTVNDVSYSVGKSIKVLKAPNTYKARPENDLESETLQSIEPEVKTVWVQKRPSFKNLVAEDEQETISKYSQSTEIQINSDLKPIRVITTHLHKHQRGRTRDSKLTQQPSRKGWMQYFLGAKPRPPRPTSAPPPPPPPPSAPLPLLPPSTPPPKEQMVQKKGSIGKRLLKAAAALGMKLAQKIKHHKNKQKGYTDLRERLATIIGVSALNNTNKLVDEPRYNENNSSISQPNPYEGQLEKIYTKYETVNDMLDRIFQHIIIQRSYKDKQHNRKIKRNDSKDNLRGFPHYDDVLFPYHNTRT